MKTVRSVLLLCSILLAMNSCSVKDIASSKLVKKTTKKVVTNTVFGNYKWDNNNLAVSTFRNGDPIAEAKTDEEWIQAAKEGKPAWCYYKNDPKNEKKYGKLYNWYAVSDARGLAPEGYRLPTEEDIDRLVKSTGKSAANSVTKELLKGGSTGFNSKLGGERSEDGYFSGLKKTGRYWTVSKYSDQRAHALYVAGKYNMSGKSDFVFANGYSVRCIKE